MLKSNKTRRQTSRDKILKDTSLIFQTRWQILLFFYLRIYELGKGLFKLGMAKITMGFQPSPILMGQIQGGVFKARAGFEFFEKNRTKFKASQGSTIQKPDSTRIYKYKYIYIYTVFIIKTQLQPLLFSRAPFLTVRKFLSPSQFSLSSLTISLATPLEP